MSLPIDGALDAARWPRLAGRLAEERALGGAPGG